MRPSKDAIMSLKAGDKVVVYIDGRTYHTPKEYLVEKVGREYLYVDNRKFRRETGSAEFGYELFPGDLAAYNEFVEQRQYAITVHRELDYKFSKLSYEDIKIIGDLLTKYE